MPLAKSWSRAATSLPDIGGGLILREKSFSLTQTAVTNEFSTPVTWVGCGPTDCFTTWAEKTFS